MSNDPTLKGVETERLEQAQEWVDRQAEALARLEPALKRLDEGADLTRHDKTILAEELGLAGDELEAARKAKANPQAMKNILREPIAHFEIERSGERIQVQVRPGGDVKFVRETDAELV